MSEEILKKNFQNKFLDFVKKNLKTLVVLTVFFTVLLFLYFLNISLQKKNEIKLSEQYTQATIHFKQKKNK